MTGTGIGVFRAFSPALGEAFGAPRRPASSCTGSPSTAATSSFLGTSTGLRLRHDQPSGLVSQRQVRRPRPLGLGRGRAPATSPTWTWGHPADLAQRLDWARRRVELPTGRYETLLPPAAVADLLIYLYWSAGAKDALDGRTVFSKPGGGTRVGERLAGLPLTLRSDPAPAAAPGLSCAPFVVAHASSAGVLGVRQRPGAPADRLDLAAASSRPCSRPGIRRGCPGCRSPRRSRT